MTCSDCVFCSVYRDMGVSCGVCTLERDASLAVRRYDHMKNVGCPMRITLKDVRSIMRDSCDKKYWGDA